MKCTYKITEFQKSKPDPKTGLPRIVKSKCKRIKGSILLCVEENCSYLKQFEKDKYKKKNGQKVRRQWV